MLLKLTSNQKILMITAIVILLAGLFIFACLILYNNLPREKETATPTPPLSIEYCRANPESICILFFSRNTGGDTVITLFVPNEFPNFYLHITRLTGDVIYECEKNEDEETKITCIGEALNLGEQIEITMISKDGDIPFAVGKFVLTAMFISSESENVNPPLLRTATPALTTRPTATRETNTSTPTPEVSYPSYP